MAYRHEEYDHRYGDEGIDDRRLGDSRSNNRRFGNGGPDDEGFFTKLKIRGKGHYETSAYFFTFLLFRALELAGLITIVGITSSWIGVLGSNKFDIPKDITIMLGFAAAGLLQCGASIYATLLGQSILLGLLSLLDLMFLIVFSLCAAKLGPVSFVSCSAVADNTAARQATTASDLVNALGSTQAQTSEAGSSFKALVAAWVRSSSQQCMQMRAAWGIFIALVILFFITLLLGLGLVYKGRKFSKYKVDQDDPKPRGKQSNHRMAMSRNER